MGSGVGQVAETTPRRARQGIPKHRSPTAQSSSVTPPQSVPPHDNSNTLYLADNADRMRVWGRGSRETITPVKSMDSVTTCGRGMKNEGLVSGVYVMPPQAQHAALAHPLHMRAHCNHTTQPSQSAGGVRIAQSWSGSKAPRTPRQATLVRVATCFSSVSPHLHPRNLERVLDPCTAK